MSRSGYSDDLEPLELGRWRGAVRSAIRGQRGQRLLRDLVAALDAMPDKRLASGAFEREDGSVCALGAVAQRRGLAVAGLKVEQPRTVARVFGIARALALEAMYVNDEVAIPPADFVPVGGCYEGPGGEQVSAASVLDLPHGERARYRWVPLTWRAAEPSDVERRQRERWATVRAWAVKNIREQENP